MAFKGIAANDLAIFMNGKGGLIAVHVHEHQEGILLVPEIIAVLQLGVEQLTVLAKRAVLYDLNAIGKRNGLQLGAACKRSVANALDGLGKSYADKRGAGFKHSVANVRKRCTEMQLGQRRAAVECTLANLGNAVGNIQGLQGVTTVECIAANGRHVLAERQLGKAVAG